MVFHTAQIGRIDETLKSVVFTDGETISKLLEKASITLSNGEVVTTLNGNTAELNEVAENDETYFITRNYKNGCN